MGATSVALMTFNGSPAQGLTTATQPWLWDAGIEPCQAIRGGAEGGGTHGRGALVPALDWP